MSENLFEVATRNKFRFPFKGNLSVEDLWELNVEDLDSIFKILNRDVKQAKEESLLGTKTKEDKILEMKINIIKHIVNVKQEEEKEKIKIKERKEQKQKIMSILATKQDEVLQNKSVEELQAMLESLD